ncbi:putative inactive nicotinamidase [Quercus suber]|uniref:Inactive nicotinamidase n=1 Tax=Quercus suber TaxID=58331 RepID=A0AAW0LUI1_QUESU
MENWKHTALLVEDMRKDFIDEDGQFEPLLLGVQTPNCIRQTAFDALALDYQSVSVIFDATAAATRLHLTYMLDSPKSSHLLKLRRDKT